MELVFSIGDTPATLHRDPFFGGMKLVTATERVWLQRPWQLSTHVTLTLDRSWERRLAGHRIRVEKTRPLLMPGVRQQTFRVFVDEQLAAEASGY